MKGAWLTTRLHSHLCFSPCLGAGFRVNDGRMRRAPRMAPWLVRGLISETKIFMTAIQGLSLRLSCRVSSPSVLHRRPTESCLWVCMAMHVGELSKVTCQLLIKLRIPGCWTQSTVLFVLLTGILQELWPRAGTSKINKPPGPMWTWILGLSSALWLQGGHRGLVLNIVPVPSSWPSCAIEPRRPKATFTGCPCS